MKNVALQSKERIAASQTIMRRLRCAALLQTRVCGQGSKARASQQSRGHNRAKREEKSGKIG